jgi:hypothetical protein
MTKDTKTLALEAVMAVLKATDFGATETYGSLRDKLEAALAATSEVVPGEEA